MKTIKETYGTENKKYLIEHRCPGLLEIWDNPKHKNFCRQKQDCPLCWEKSIHLYVQKTMEFLEWEQNWYKNYRRDEA